MTTPVSPFPFHNLMIRHSLVSATNSNEKWSIIKQDETNYVMQVRVCRSVHLHTFSWINQPDAAINYRFNTCGLITAQHVSGILMPIIRSLSTTAAVSGIPLERGRTDHDQQHCYHHVRTVYQRLLLHLIGSWWWAEGCPKHVELYLNDKQ